MIFILLIKYSFLFHKRMHSEMKETQSNICLVISIDHIHTQLPPKYAYRENLHKLCIFSNERGFDKMIYAFKFWHSPRNKKDRKLNFTSNENSFIAVNCRLFSVLNEN